MFLYSNFLDTDPQTSAGLCQEILVAMKNRSHLGPQLKRNFNSCWSVKPLYSKCGQYQNFSAQIKRNLNRMEPPLATT